MANSYSSASKEMAISRFSRFLSTNSTKSILLHHIHHYATYSIGFNLWQSCWWDPSQIIAKGIYLWGRLLRGKTSSDREDV